VVRERERQAEHPRQLCAEAAGPEQPDRRHVPVAGYGGDQVVVALEVADQVAELLREALGGQAGHGAPQRERGPLVGAGRTADAEVDPAGVQRLQRAELLGDDQWRVVGQHHPAGTHPDGGRVGREVRDQHGG
jgi:hypothetical protein